MNYSKIYEEIDSDNARLYSNDFKFVMICVAVFVEQVAQTLNKCHGSVDVEFRYINDRNMGTIMIEAGFLTCINLNFTLLETDVTQSSVSDHCRFILSISSNGLWPLEARATRHNLPTLVSEISHEMICGCFSSHIKSEIERYDYAAQRFAATKIVLNELDF